MCESRATFWNALLTPLFGLSQITELYSDHFPKLVQTIKDMSDEKTRIVLAFGAFLSSLDTWTCCLSLSIVFDSIEK